MALPKNFSNAVADKKEEKKEKKELDVLKENDKNTIFNLLFKDSLSKKSEE